MISIDFSVEFNDKKTNNFILLPIEKSPLMNAIYFGRIDILENLLKDKKQIFDESFYGVSSFEFALVFSSDIAIKMIDLINNIDEPINSFDQTALHLATLYESYDGVKYLLKKGANCNLKDDLDMTPIHIACLRNNMPIIKLLSKYGINTWTKDFYLKTPNDYFTVFCQKKISQKFVDKIKKLKREIHPNQLSF